MSEELHNGQKSALLTLSQSDMHACREGRKCGKEGGNKSYVECHLACIALCRYREGTG